MKYLVLIFSLIGSMGVYGQVIVTNTGNKIAVTDGSSIDLTQSGTALTAEITGYSGATDGYIPSKDGASITWIPAPLNPATTVQVFDDFLGFAGGSNGTTSFGWSTVTNNGTIAVPSGTEANYNHPGVCIVESSGSAGAQTPWARIGSSKTPVKPLHTFEALINTENFTASNDFFIGYSSLNALSNTDDFIGFFFDGSGNIEFKYCNGGGSITTVSTTVAEVSGDWVKVKFAMNAGGDFLLYVDDALEVTHTPTGNLPDGTSGDFMQIAFFGDFTTSSPYRVLVDYISTSFQVTR